MRSPDSIEPSKVYALTQEAKSFLELRLSKNDDTMMPRYITNYPFTPSCDKLTLIFFTIYMACR